MNKLKDKCKIILVRLVRSNKPQGPQNMWLFLCHEFKVARSGAWSTTIIFLCIFLKDYKEDKTRTIFVACAYNVMGITTFDVYAANLLGKITSLRVDGIFHNIVLLTY